MAFLANGLRQYWASARRVDAITFRHGR